MNPLNSNNIATYVVRPLMDLPPAATLRLVVVDSALNANPGTGANVGPIDLTGNFHSPGSDDVTEYLIGPGRALVNAPVSPEVIYWLPNARRGLGAIDLNGEGFTTNMPGANKDDYRKAAIITRVATGVPGTGGAIFNKIMNLENGIGILGHPPGFAHNQYLWKVGTGSYTYGWGDPNSPDFEDPSDPGNTGTPVPGLNEMSSGYQTMVRNAAGEVILTGEEFGTVGAINDCCIGEFLDAAIFDTQSIFNTVNGHASFYWGTALDTNSINEAPMPNPPPTRFWVGLSPIDILIDQSSPSGAARVITGEEVWAGDHSLDQLLLGLPPQTGIIGRSYQWVLPNRDSPLLPDIPPRHFDMVPSGAWRDQSGTPNAHWGRSLGPAPQSASLFVRHSARQQIGNFLYVTDAENGQLHALNSNTMEIIESLDLPDPTEVAVSSDARFFFVSNASDNSVSVLGGDPQFPDFHTEVARIDVGRFPNPIAVQPDDEDVFVGNLGDDSLSIISLGDLTVRKTIDSLIDNPVDIVLAPRQNGFGFLTGIYFGYIANFGGNNVLVFESGPDGPQGIGCDEILGSLPSDDDESGIEIVEPRGLCYSPYTNDQNVHAGGVFIAHRDMSGTGLVSHIQFTHQIIPGVLPCVQPPGLFNIPPGFNDRTWEVTGQWGATDGSRLIARKPTSVRLADFRRDYLELEPSISPNNSDRGGPPVGGVNSRHPIRFLPITDPRFPIAPAAEADRMYVSFEDSDKIQVLSPLEVGVAIDETEGAGPGITIRKLITYFE